MISLYDILEATNGHLFGEPRAQTFVNFCFEAAKTSPSELFVVNNTEYTDEQAAIEEAIQRGATGVICTVPPNCNTDEITVILSRNPVETLITWSKLRLRTVDSKIIVVAGSTGKSIAFEAIKQTLSTEHSVFAPTVHQKGLLTIPQILVELDSNPEFIIFKFNLLHPGELGLMLQAVQPEACIITHIEDFSDNFDSATTFELELRKLVASLPLDGHAVLNFDNTYIRDLVPLTRANVTSFGIDSFGSDLVAFNIVDGLPGTSFDLRYNHRRIAGCWMRLLGKQGLYSILGAIALVTKYDISIESALTILTDMTPLAGHMNPLRGESNCLIIDKTHDATQRSVIMALEWLQAIGKSNKRKIFIFGDLNYSVKASQSVYREIGEMAANVTDIIITQGTESALIGRTARDRGVDYSKISHTHSTQETLLILEGIKLGEDDILLITGGNSAEMEEVVEGLIQNNIAPRQLVQRDKIESTVRLLHPTQPSWIEISKEAIANNMRAIKTHLDDDISLMAVIKADAYGHGALTVARTVLAQGADYLAVASISEAFELRDNGIDAPVLVMSYTPIHAVRQAIRKNITITIYDMEIARAYNVAAQQTNGILNVHVKVDTGMGRLGFVAGDTISVFRQLVSFKNLHIEGIYTHFSAADEDHEYTDEQLHLFEGVLQPLKASGFDFKYIHAANSAAILRTKHSYFNLVRPGLLIYGLHPYADEDFWNELQPALTWKTVVSQLKELPLGSYIGYGKEYRTSKNEKIAVLPIGYSDGFRRSPNTWKEVLIHGMRAPVVGRISMEKATIDVTHVPDVSIGDEVVLLGKQGDDEISAEEIAEWLGTVNYEVVTTILPRVPRRRLGF